MKYWTSLLVAAVFNMFLLSEASALVSVPSQPFPKSSPLLITGYGVSSDVRSVDFVQLYNDSDSLLILDGWKLAYTTTTDAKDAIIAPLQGYMLPESHLVLASDGVLEGEGVIDFVALSLPVGAKLKSLVIVPPQGISRSEQPIAGAGIYRRNIISSGYSTSSTFIKQDSASFTTLAADPLYIVPGTPQLKIVEILPRSAECAPDDESLVCGDYVKLQNTSDTVYDTSNYRLRSDSGSSESSNAFSLNALLEPGAFMTVYLKDDDSKLSLNDGGGYVWLEDAMGLAAFYNETMVGYPSASSVSKQGWSWALGGDGNWQWTSTPQPDAVNRISAPKEEVFAVATDSECPAGKYRNPETGRCKNIEDAIATLVACDEDEFRSPETNRCRKLVSTAGAVLTPCEPGEERNPSTNRCRTILASAGQVTACPEGQERNPSTNRCRKIVSTTSPPSFTDAPKEQGQAGYWVGGAVVTAALGYGLYEWRAELFKLVRRFVPLAK